MQTVRNVSNSVECGLAGQNTREVVAANVTEFHALLFNIQGLTKEKVGLLSKLISSFELVALTETHIPLATFGFPDWSVFASPRTVQHAHGENHGGVAFLLRGDALARLVRRLGEADRVPPETVAIELDGALFQSARNVVCIVAYATRDGQKISSAYLNKYGKSILNMLSEFIMHQRNKGFEVLLCGDFNAYTMSRVGWNGSDSLYSESETESYYRVSQCKQTALDVNGRELLQLCVDGELRLLNGLRSSQRALDLDESVTRISGQDSGRTRQAGARFSLLTRLKQLTANLSQTLGLQSLERHWLAPAERQVDRAGSVLDYFAVSAGLIQSRASLVVLPREEPLSDHCPVRYSFFGSRGLSDTITLASGEFRLEGRGGIGVRAA